MTEEARKAYNKYQKQWRDKNKDKVKANMIRHWEKVAREVREVENK